ncbi:MAG: lysophospholipase [Oscillospiraceae bacterium]|nr:lysophospholipase [Oscillospiraceae bacterium]
MPTFRDFYYDSSTGKNKLHARICKPDDSPRGIVQIIHGIGEHINRYDDFMMFLASNGFIAVGNDHLGHGKSISVDSEKGFFADSDGWEYVVSDEEILRRAMKENYPGVPQIVFGHSMGSFIARTHLIKYPGAFDAAVISGTGNQGKALVFGGRTMGNLVVGLKGPHHYSSFLNGLAFGSYNKIYDTQKTDFDWLTRDEEAIKKYIADPLCGFIPSCSMFRDMMDGVTFITNVKNLQTMKKDVPVFFISGSMDPVGECGKGVKKAFENFKNAGMADVSMKLYEGGRHEMLNELNKSEVYADILAWLESKI